MVSEMIECQERHMLSDLWHRRAKEFDACAVALANAKGGEDYVHALLKLDEARLAMDNALTMLQIHVAEHGCAEP
jgi:hypothetical protein